jgi:hypothetical protein
MGKISWRAVRLVPIIASLILSGCGFLPGFSVFEAPTLYHLPVGDAAIRIACETQEFLKDYNPRDSRWLLAQQDVTVKLTLTTDDSGYVNFTGVNVASAGLGNLAQLIATTTSGNIKVPTLAAKGSLKRTKTVEIDFSVSPTAYTSSSVKQKPCPQALQPSPVKLYLKEWLNNYFATINYPTERAPQNQDIGDFAANLIRAKTPSDELPEQLKIQHAVLSTTILFAADISGGATPNILGNGSVFILPVNGLTLDYNPDYSHKLEMTFTMCDKLVDENCQPKLNEDRHPKPERISPLLVEQCALYAKLFPLLSGVKPPKDALDPKNNLLTCNKQGCYVPKPTGDTKRLLASPIKAPGCRAEASLRIR